MKVLRPVTPKEFSEAIGGILTADTIREHCRTGKIKTIRGPHYLIPWSEVEKYLPAPSFMQRFLVTL